MSLSPDRASTLPMYRALTECDTVSIFGGSGKKNGLGCEKRSQGGCMVVLERFVVLIYDLTSSLTKVNETLQKLFF